MMSVDIVMSATWTDGHGLDGGAVTMPARCWRWIRPTRRSTGAGDATAEVCSPARESGA
jgi:hypothetical protein